MPTGVLGPGCGEPDRMTTRRRRDLRRAVRPRRERGGSRQPRAGHRCLGLHRRAPGGRAARGRVPGPLPGADAGQARRRAVARPRSRWSQGDVTGDLDRRAGRGRRRATTSSTRSARPSEWDRAATARAAANFRDAAAAAGVRRIVYLGGLGGRRRRAELSPHLASRHEVGRGAGRRPGAGHRAARRGDHRLGLRVVRDAALPGRGAAGDGHAQVGRHALPADRRPRRPALPRRRAGRAARPPAGSSRSAAPTCSPTAR